MISVIPSPSSLAGSFSLSSPSSSMSQPRLVIPGTTFAYIPSRRDDGSVSFEGRRTFAPWNVKNLIFDYESPIPRRLLNSRKRSKSTAMSGFTSREGASVDHGVLLSTFTLERLLILDLYRQLHHASAAHKDVVLRHVMKIFPCQ